MSLNFQLSHHQFLTDDNRVDWEEINNQVITQPDEVDKFTLGYAVQIGQRRTNPVTNNPLPSKVVRNVLKLSKFNVQNPWKVLGTALVNHLVVPEVFETLLEESQWLVLDVHSPIQLLSALWLNHRWNERKLIILLNFLQANSLWACLSSTFYGAIIACEPIRILSLVMESAFVGHNTIDILTSKKVCGPWGERTENCLQALARYGRYDAMQIILKHDVLMHEDVVNFRLLDIVAQGQPISRSHDEDRVQLAKLYIYLNPTALCIPGDDNGETLPIYHACESGNLELIKLYLAEGVKSQVHGPNGRGGLFLPVLTSNGDNLGYNLLQLLLDNSEVSTADMDVDDFDELIKYLVASSSSLLVAEDVVRYELLHIVLQDTYQNVEAARNIIILAPFSLSNRNECGGLPIHSAVKRYPKSSIDCQGLYELYGELRPNMLQLLIEESMTRKVFDVDNTWGILERNEDGHTVLDLILQFCKKADFYYQSDNYGPEFHDDDAYRELLVRFWQCLGICWENSNNDIPILQAAIETGVSAHRVKEIIERFNCAHILDQNGNLPLHLALERGINWDDYARGLSIILSAYEEAASVLDSQGRLPLHSALESDMFSTWSVGIKQLVNAYPVAVESRCTHSNLHPFMIAASKNVELEVIYYLLRTSPGHVF
jgi:hypothetical protein